MMKLTKEESVFVKQLFDIRKQIEILEIERKTHTDRLLTILRGHRVKDAYTDDRSFEILRYQSNGKEGILILNKP